MISCHLCGANHAEKLLIGCVNLHCNHRYSCNLEKVFYPKFIDSTYQPTSSDSLNHLRRPVLVWVHGGAFIFGGAKVYNPRYIMEEDVVVVVLQYRLNIFGFLSLEDAVAPGNYGMLDQVEAMR